MRTLLKLIIPAFVFTSLVFSASEASAQLSRHERVKVTPIKKAGAVVGARLKLTLRPGYNHKRVRVGLGPMTFKAGSGNNWNAHRDLASNPKKGYLVHQFKEISGLQQNKPLEKKFEIRYGKGSKFKGGEKLEVISAWNSGSKDTYWHVWGMQGVHGVKDKGSVVTLPKATKATAKPRAKKPATPKKPAKPRAKKPAKPKKPAASGSTRTRRAAAPK